MQKVLTNGSEIKSEIISKINNSTKSIKIAIAYFTDQDIANALIEAHKKGVNTRVIVDDSNSNYPMFEYLKTFGILRSHKTSSKYGIMHLKHNLIDDSILLHGTFNYTKNASLNNTESLYITDDKAAIESFSKQFEDLIEDSQIISSESTYPEQITESTKTQPTSMTTNTSNEFDIVIDEYTSEIENHVKSVFLPTSNDEIKESGYNDATLHNGAVSSYLMYCDQTLQDMSFEVNNSDQNISKIKTRITNCFENVKNRLTELGEIRINSEKDNCKINIKALQERKKIIDEDKINLSQKKTELTLEIEKLTNTKDNYKQKIEDIEIEHPVKSFWRIPIFFRLFFLLLFFTHLSLFFASAFYKIFLEKDAVKRLSESGIEAKPGSIYDLDALTKLLDEGGSVFLISGMLFFIIPIVMTNIKLFKKDVSHLQERFFFYLGILAFDIIVAFVISFHSHEIKNLIDGTTYEWDILGALLDPNFYLIFLFGALPLFLVKLLLPFLYDSYNNSSLDLISTKRFIESNNYKDKIDDINMSITAKRAELEDLKLTDAENTLEQNTLRNELLSAENYSDTKVAQIQEIVATRIHQATKIYQSFISDIESGNNIFLGRIVRQRLTPFKAGYVQFYNLVYAQSYASKYINELEINEVKWFSENFK
jgi:hypothetical protein